MNAPLDPLAAFRLDGQVALVTGASSGLGARFARVLDALGATVVVSARRLDRLEALAGDLQRGHAAVCDVSEPGASAALVDQLVADHGRVDVIVANAGITSVAPALREDPAEFARVVAVDLVALYELARAAALHMKTSGGGRIVFTASAAAFSSSPLLPQAGYVASKTALLGLVRELSLQWARYGIRVNALCPGMFPSEMTEVLVETPALREAYEDKVPLGRVGQEHELDGALAFLASDASSYMTGQFVLVDGGGKS